MAFYAYSPLAGGFLTKTKQEILDGKNRFDPNAMGGLYAKLYNRPAYLEALEHWEKVAKSEGISEAELAYRWVTYNSPLKKENGDAIIFGASSLDQIKKTLGYIHSGPLSEKALKGVDEVWKTVEHEAPLDNYHL
jgi:aflatoxin B1 aldehyde reductase